MKQKVAIVILLIVSLGLGGALIWRGKEYVEVVRKDTALITQYSNEWRTASGNVEELKSVNEGLLKELEKQTNEVQSLTTALTEEKAARDKVVADAQKAAQLAREEMEKRDTQIAALETQVTEKSKQMVEKNNEIMALAQKIADVEKELATTKANKDFLLKELQRLQAEKARLEQQFNDLALLREQVRRLKDELALQRRLEWIRSGVYSPTSAKGGAQKLMQPTKVTTNRPNPTLDVQLNVDGTVRVAPGTTNATPAPK